MFLLPPSVYDTSLSYEIAIVVLYWLPLARWVFSSSSIIHLYVCVCLVLGKSTAGFFKLRKGKVAIWPLALRRSTTEPSVFQG